MSHLPDSHNARDAATTPAGITTTCPQCGVTLDALATACAHCGAVVTGGGPDGERAERVRQRLQGQIGASYELGALIGRGGMGIVFRARELSLDREVALKVLAFDPILNPDAFTRFEREAKLAARLDHPNIVPIFAVGQGDGVAFYTMRFVRGGSLEALVAREGALALDRAVPLLRDVASALDFAHGQGVVHRDIKPANILLSDSGHALVADFGIARAFSGDAATSTSGSHTGVVGSPAYMAPEQWRGEKPDGRADQYALGVLAFELLSGGRPWRDVSMQELLRLHLGAEPPAIESVRTGLPPRVGLAIRRAMAKDPSDRFSSSAAFVAALAGETAVGAAPRRAAARTQPVQSTRERSVQWIGSALAGVMVLTAAAVGVIEWRRARAVPMAPVAAVDTLTSRLTRELEETRKIALDAQRRAERAEAEARAQTKTQALARASAPSPATAHVSVAVRGGAPRLIIDGQEGAVSTPAIIEVPPGRHVVRVEAAGRRYQPAQYVIDLSAGDTSQLVFADERIAGRDAQLPQRQLPQPQQQPPQPGTALANPYFLPGRIWQNMPPEEQAKLRARWDLLSPAQRQQRVLREFQGLDSAGAGVRRRPPKAPSSALPAPPPS